MSHVVNERESLFDRIGHMRFVSSGLGWDERNDSDFHRKLVNEDATIRRAG